MLRSLELEGFRTFKHLSLRGLGAVNLITGRNNVGKTVLLEALRIYGARGDHGVIEEQLRRREELNLPGGRARGTVGTNLSALFHGRPKLNGEPLRFDLGPIRGEGPKLTVRAGFVQFEHLSREPPSFVLGGSSGARDDLEVGVGVRWDDGPEDIARYPNPGYLLAHWGDPTGLEGEPAARGVHHETPFISSRGMSNVTAAQWWDTVSLSDAEARVIECLRIVTPVERIALVQSNEGHGGRTFVLKLEGERERLPMRALGDGVGRMFWMALAMEVAREGKLLLIDEIENGIHYSVLPDFWGFVLQAARAAGVQVFATTHSWDCIEAFQSAVHAQGADGALVRLTERGGAVVPTVFSRDELAIATRDQIELR
jgi:hypothetical protein